MRLMPTNFLSKIYNLVCTHTLEYWEDIGANKKMDWGFMKSRQSMERQDTRGKNGEIGITREEKYLQFFSNFPKKVSKKTSKK